ncbi:MAG TPA: ornithine cyclodeaminase family protein [Pyrinomonadaceae bacterium]|nr:ornithine cyclodeaminase family protein [Pyrinomonadaceae bacterium]
MKLEGTLLLTRHDVMTLLSIGECIAAVESVFKLHGEGKAAAPAILGIHTADGGFHIKAGLLDLDRPSFAAKINANFPNNPKQFGLPTIQGLVVLCDGEYGSPLAVMDSMEITTQRTGAATAVAAKYLAKSDSKTMTVCGCGNQGAISVRALAGIFLFEKVFAYDLNPAQAERFANELSNELGLEVREAEDLEIAVRQSEIVVTCTPSKEPFLQQRFVRPGTFIAAVGADSGEKQELDTHLLAENKVVVDVLDQCLSIGELHHALEERLMSGEDVHAELGAIIAGIKSGRTSADEIIIFDSTGMALQDVITAVIIYDKALKNGVGTVMKFAR